MTERERKKENLSDSQFTASIVAADLFIYTSRNNDIGPIKKILNVGKSTI